MLQLLSVIFVLRNSIPLSTPARTQRSSVLRHARFRLSSPFALGIEVQKMPNEKSGIFLYLVPERGLEPPCLAASGPKPDVSTNFTTPATGILYHDFPTFPATISQSARSSVGRATAS